jgi:hypothetical protein|tara:strand:+ start:2069 stop:2419 length:351 start_codon:yes stop_codon:yes gene_type:complete
MSSEVKNFIDKLSAGKNAEAGDSFKDALRVKVGDALDNKRQDVAGNMFNAQAFSSPKPDIATPGQFNQDGTITNVDGTPGESGPELAAATAPEVAEPVATEAPADAPEVSLDNVGA